MVRNPYLPSSVPKYVLEPLSAYLEIAQKQYEDPGIPGYYNVGPDEATVLTTGELVTLFQDLGGWSLRNQR